MAVSPSSLDSVVFIGIDVASRECTAALEGRRPRCFKFSAEGAAQLAAWTRQVHPGARLRAVLEHTGVYSQAWAALLAEQGLESALCNPAKIHYHAIADGQRSKTDKADAKAILSYALHYRPEATTQAPKAQQQLNVLLVTRDLLIRQRVALENSITTLSFLPENLALVEEQCEHALAALKQGEAELEEKMAAAIKHDERLSQASRILLQQDGIGRVCTAMLCAMLDRVLDFNPKQLTAWCGMAPAHRQSGTSQKPSHIDKQGKALIRRNLYLAGLGACRTKTYAPLKASMEAQGKPGKVIIIAIGRRVLINAQKALKAHFSASGVLAY